MKAGLRDIFVSSIFELCFYVQEDSLFDFLLLNKEFHSMATFFMKSRFSFKRLYSTKHLALYSDEILELRFGSANRNVITDTCLKKFTNLTSLELIGTSNVTDDGISELTNLTALNLTSNKRISGECLLLFSNLRELNLSDNDIIRNDHIARLSKLTSLNLANNILITPKVLAGFPSLTSLCCPDYFDDTLNIPQVNCFTRLKFLRLSNSCPLDLCACYLTNLTRLELRMLHIHRNIRLIF
jgi:hypothetical protein